MQTREDTIAPTQQLMEFPEHLTGNLPSTRILRVFGPAETVNAEYLQWLWVRKFCFELEHINDNSLDSVMGDFELWFATEDQARLAYDAMDDPDFTQGLLETITVEFRPEL